VKADGDVEESDKEWDRKAGRRADTSIEFNMNPLNDGFSEQPMDLLFDASIRVRTPWKELQQRTPDESPFFHPDIMRRRRKKASGFVTSKKKHSKRYSDNRIPSKAEIIANIGDQQIEMRTGASKIISVVKF
jgi:hypothetical protein